MPSPAQLDRKLAESIRIEHRYQQAAQFADLLTGDDDDIILAAETAIRDALGRRAGQEVELWPEALTPDLVKALRAALG